MDRPPIDPMGNFGEWPEDSVPPQPDEDDHIPRDTGVSNYKTYGGVEMQAIAVMEDRQAILGDLMALSWSTHREKNPIPVLGKTDSLGYTRGRRTYAGSLIFATYNSAALSSLATYHYETFITPSDLYSMPLPDMLPPFDIVCTFANEYGQMSRMIYYGVDIVNDGGQYSVQDIYPEETMSFVCRRIDRMTKIGTQYLQEVVLTSGYFDTRGMRFLLNMGANFYNTPFDYQLPGGHGNP